MDLVNQSGTPKLWAIAYKNGPKMQTRRVLWALYCVGLVNHPGTPKLWAIAHENGYKRKNNEFSIMHLKHVVSVMGHVNHPSTPKLWAIAHENDPKMQKG
jgi:hypothetical protein